MELLQDLCRRWGTFDVDLLMFRFNNKLNRFVSSYREHLAEVVHGLVALWDQYTLIYAFSSAAIRSSSTLQDLV